MSPDDGASHRQTVDELLAQATGEFVLNLDGDDYLHDPEFLSEAAKLIKDDPATVMVVAQTQFEERVPFSMRTSSSAPLNQKPVLFVNCPAVIGP